MDVMDNADGSLDPRIQIELENLNDATDDINKLETELDEAHTAFRQLLSETTKRLMEITNKLGNSCIEKARCYYEALEVARQAQVKCQQQAQLFQRASEIHAAAKETVALAESRFMSHQHEWNFDQAWQDMLNHATIKVMDAENQKAECGREHYRRAILFHDAEKKLLELEEKHRRSIIKARPYFEIKAQCDQMLATQKERVECLQKAIQDAKANYATSLRTLEEISNQIHQQRQDDDFIANGPREPGVGAELVSPQKTLSYDTEFNQLNNKTKNIANNNPKNYNRIEDYSNAFQLQEDNDHLGKRSVDGSEATSSQWELELQASMENLNNMSFENSVHDNDTKNESISNLRFYNGKNIKSNNSVEELNCNFSQNRGTSTYIANQFQKFSKNFQALKHSLGSMTLLKHIRESSTVGNESGDSTHLNKCKANITNKLSKSLSNSPTKMDACKNSLGSIFIEKVESRNFTNYVPNKVFDFSFNNNKSQSNGDINSSFNIDASTIEKYQSLNDILDDKTDNFEFDSQIVYSKYDKELMKVIMQEVINSTCVKLNTCNDRNIQLKNDTPSRKKWFRSNSSQFLSHNSNLSPVKLKQMISLPDEFASLHKNITDDSNKKSDPQKLVKEISNVKETPLLSLFEKTNSFVDSRSKSRSMINLDMKQNFVSLDNVQLNNMKSVSAERLTDVKNNLFLKVSR